MRVQSSLALSVLFALACESPPGEPVSRVQADSADRFKVSYGSLWTADKARVDAHDEANRFCAGRNALMMPDSEVTPANDPSLSFELIFHCEPMRQAN